MRPRVKSTRTRERDIFLSTWFKYSRRVDNTRTEDKFIATGTGWAKKSGIQVKYRTREDAIAAVLVMIAKAIESIPQSHPDIEAAHKKASIEVQEKIVEVIKNSEVWD